MRSTLLVLALCATPLLGQHALVLSQSSDTTPESGVHVFTVTRTGGTDFCSVDYTTVLGSAEAEDLVEASGTLVFSGAVSSNTVAVAIKSDSVLEGDEVFSLQLSNVVGTSCTIDASSNDLEVAIVDDDAAQVSLAPVLAVEGDAKVVRQLVATLDNGVEGGFTVDVTLQDGSAVSGEDYEPASATLTFAGSAGEQQMLAIEISGDEVVEDEEAFSAVLANLVQPQGLAVGLGGSASITIADDDFATVEIEGVKQAEGDGGLTDFHFVLRADAAVDSGYTLGVITQDGDPMFPRALGGQDFEPVLAGSVSFTGQAAEQQTFVVKVIGDRFDTEELVEAFHLCFDGPPSFADGRPRAVFLRLDDGSGYAATGFIEDDDIDGDRDGLPRILDPDDNDPDTDGDGVEDGIEHAVGLDPLDPGDASPQPDSDGDGIPDAIEDLFPGLLDRDDPDFDNDGTADGFQLAAGGLPLQGVFLGDVNGDGVVDPADVSHLFRQVRGLRPAATRAVDADINRDGVLDNVDVMLLLYHLRGLHPRQIPIGVFTP